MKTTNYNLNLIEKSDRILNTLDDLNENFNNIDSELYEKEKELTTTKQKLERTEQRLEKVEKKVDQAEAILDTSKSNGENVYFDNAKNYPLMSLKGDGKSEQVTTTGKNLLKKYSNTGSHTIYGVTVTQNEDGTFSINGTASNEFWIEYVFDFKNATGYKDYYSFLLDSSKEYTHSMVQLGGSFTGSINSTLGTNLIADSSGNKVAKVNNPITFTSAEGISRGFFWIAKNSTFSNAIIGVQLEEGAVATEFEPYTNGQATPNPDYPQEISTISEASYKGVGKNLYDFKNVEFVNSPYSSSEITENGFKIISKQDGTYRYTRHLLKNFKKYLGKTLYFSCNLKASSKNTPLIIFTWSNSSNPNFKTISTFRATDTVIEVPFPESIPSGAENVSILFYSNGSGESVVGDYVEYSNIILAKENITAYQPYHENTLPIDLQGNELASVGTVSDKLLIDRKGNVAIEKHVGKSVFLGAEEENWVRGTTEKGYRYRIDVNNIKINKSTETKPKLIASNFQTITPGDTWLSKTGITVYETSNRLAICYESDFTNTVAKFKTWLQENNVTAYYELATPELISLGTIENPEIFKGVNNITVETNIGNINVEVEYVEDLQKRIEKIEQAIVALGGV